ncbi:MAG: glycosyltransferase family 39 protein [Actinomycetota bacterium]|nr:glycosyltransferase family 39 protein [Actinomycetota bacterium]
MRISLLCIFLKPNRNGVIDSVANRFHASRYAVYLAARGGLMLLCKLQAAIVYPSLLLFLLTSRKSRHWLWKKGPYLGFGIAILMFIPAFP